MRLSVIVLPLPGLVTLGSPTISPLVGRLDPCAVAAGAETPPAPSLSLSSPGRVPGSAPPGGGGSRAMRHLLMQHVLVPLHVRVAGLEPLGAELPQRGELLLASGTSAASRIPRLVLLSTHASTAPRPVLARPRTPHPRGRRVDDRPESRVPSDPDNLATAAPSSCVAPCVTPCDPVGTPRRPNFGYLNLGDPNAAPPRPRRPGLGAAGRGERAKTLERRLPRRRPQRASTPRRQTHPSAAKKLARSLYPPPFSRRPLRAAAPSSMRRECSRRVS